jgi:hypothetical protein
MRLDRRAVKFETSRHWARWTEYRRSLCHRCSAVKRPATQVNIRKRHISICYASIQRILRDDNMWTIVISTRAKV